MTSDTSRHRSREAAHTLAAVQSHFPALALLWHSEIGLQLQRVDSDLCGQVQREMRAQGIPVLSVHDSFIAPRRAESELRAAMEKAFLEIWDNLAAHVKQRYSALETIPLQKPF